MCHSCIGRYYSKVVLLLLFLVQWQFSNCYADSFDWSLVKPMHLVSLYPPPAVHQDRGNQGDLYNDHAALDDMDDDSLPPTIVNMEAESVGNDNYNDYDNDNEKGHDDDDGDNDDDGMRNIGRDAAMDRIFGGNTAHTNCFPYQVGLLLQRPKGLYWCGGSLISDAFVLTAAHCVDM